MTHIEEIGKCGKCGVLYAHFLNYHQRRTHCHISSPVSRFTTVPLDCGGATLYPSDIQACIQNPESPKFLTEMAFPSVPEEDQTKSQRLVRNRCHLVLALLFCVCFPTLFFLKASLLTSISSNTEGPMHLTSHVHQSHDLKPPCSRMLDMAGRSCSRWVKLEV